MQRREFLGAIGGSGAAFATTGILNPDIGGPVSQLPTTVGQTILGPEIEAIKYPLTFVPAIKEPGETLALEVSTGVDDPTIYIQPQHGEVQPRIELDPHDSYTAKSRIWRGEDVRVFECEIPAIGGDVVETMYDIVIEDGLGADGQRSALSLVETFPENPTVVVFTDSHIGHGHPDDLGHLTETIENNVAFTVEQVIGAEPAGDRWPDTRRAVEEVNLLDPDIVLTCGDLFDAQDYPGKYYMEFWDGHHLYSQLEAPTYTTLGNHDGYFLSALDGKQLYEHMIAPAYYSLDIRPGLRLVSVNTYDWSAIDRKGFSFMVSAWGGQIREEQLEWLRTDLTDWRADNPDGDLLVLSHFNPLWPDGSETRAGTVDRLEGIPVFYQFARGIDAFFLENGVMGWYGENRLAYRELLDEVGVDCYFAGHTHRDRLSRMNDDIVVQTDTTGLPEYGEDGSAGELVAITQDNEVDDSYSQDELATAIRNPELGPLFVETTHLAGGPGVYPGWRQFELDFEDLDPARWGYPLGEDEQADGAERQYAYNPDHVRIGTFSTPQGRIEIVEREDGDSHVDLTFESELRVPFEGAIIVSVRDAPAVTVQGGEDEWRRRGDEWQDLKVGFTVPAGETHQLRIGV